MIHNSLVGPSDRGYFPRSGLSLGTDGNLYGATSRGGSNSAGSFFKITPGGTLTVVGARFTIGGEARAALLRLPDGSFFESTDGTAGPYPSGTVFRLTARGQPIGNETPLSVATGANPEATLTIGEAGNLYGTAGNGGTNGLGTIFQVAPDGAVSALFSFAGAMRARREVPW